MLNFKNVEDVLTNGFILVILVLIDFVIREAKIIDIIYLGFVIYSFIAFLCIRFDISIR